ncbi:MAG: MATE family efflux transporter [Bacteroidales bacterium]|nr:MATE family efflux transporter [Bacteroidales bacterium]MBR4273836.1 MATE family efflux transporter [Bacteroidales bacterium]
MRTTHIELLEQIRNHGKLTTRQQVSLTAKLSMPAILAQISFILMQYIDASMVGHLGAEYSAAVGLVSSTTWLFFGLTESLVAGFAVLVAHRLGARDNRAARDILRQSLTVCLLWAVVLSGVGMAISPFLPVWLNGGDDVASLSSSYFMIFSAGLPFFQLNYFSASMLRSSGNVKFPSVLNFVMCILDVIFNYFLINNPHEVTILGTKYLLHCAGLGVSGAALGSVLAVLIVSVVMAWYLFCRSKELRIYGERGSFRPERDNMRHALKIGVPIGGERSVMSLAYTIIIAIVAPLGNVSLSADTLAVTIEGLCYMPGYGIADAATTLIGQCVGAGRKRLAKSFAKITVLSGMIVLTVMSLIMFLTARYAMSLMTPVDEIIDLGTTILRIESFAEPFFGAAIVCYGVFVGAGSSVAPIAINVSSMWIIRIPLSFFIVGKMGLTGVWVVMASEIAARGIIHLIYLRSGRWLHTQAMREAIAKNRKL